MKVKFYRADDQTFESATQPITDDGHTIYLNGTKQEDVLLAWPGEGDNNGVVVMLAHHHLEPGRRLRSDTHLVLEIQTPLGPARLETNYEYVVAKGDVVIEKKTKHPREILEEMGGGRLPDSSMNKYRNGDQNDTGRMPC